MASGTCFGTVASRYAGARVLGQPLIARPVLPCATISRFFESVVRRFLRPSRPAIGGSSNAFYRSASACSPLRLLPEKGRIVTVHDTANHCRSALECIRPISSSLIQCIVCDTCRRFHPVDGAFFDAVRKQSLALSCRTRKRENCRLTNQSRTRCSACRSSWSS